MCVHVRTEVSASVIYTPSRICSHRNESVKFVTAIFLPGTQLGDRIPCHGCGCVFQVLGCKGKEFSLGVLLGRDRLHMHACVGEKAPFPLHGVGGCSRELLVLLES